MSDPVKPGNSDVGYWNDHANTPNLIYDGMMSGYILELPKVDLETGLVAYYPFNGNANDESGNGNDGTVNGATLAADRNGDSSKAYKVSKGNKIELPAIDDIAGANSRTISIWLKNINSPLAAKPFVYGDKSSHGRTFGIVYDEEWHFWGHYVSHRIGTLDADWRLHTVSYDNGTIKYYIDGNLKEGETQGVASINTTKTPISIGSWESDPDTVYFDGEVDDVRIYNRALSETEVAELYALEKPQAQPGDLLWSFEAEGVLHSTPAIGGDGTIFIYSGGNDSGSTGKLYALNGTTGVKNWEFAAPSGAYLTESSPAIGVDGTVYVGSWANTVYALDGKNGSEKWAVQLGASGALISSPAIGNDGTIYIASWDSNVYALDKTTGSKKWAFNSGAGRIFSSPAIDNDGTVYVGSMEGEVYALSGETGNNLWKFQADGGVYSSPTIGGDGTVFVGSDNGKVYALNGKTGAMKWEFQTGDKVVSSVSIGSDGSLYLGSYDDRIYALDENTGAKLWDFETGGDVYPSPAIGDDGTVYVGSDDNSFYALDGKTGAVIFEFQTGEDVFSSAAIGSDGTVFFGSDDSKLYALKTSSTGPADSPWPMFGQNAQRTGRAPSTSGSVGGGGTTEPTVVSINPDSGSFGSGAGSGEVAVSASGGAQWTAKSDSPWITVTDGSSGVDSFETHIITTSLQDASSVYAADMDGDGDMDVLSASESDDTIVWYENDGTENFITHTITTTADIVWNVHAADVDDDGDLDVLSANWGDHTIPWYKNDGNGNFCHSDNHFICTLCYVRLRC